MKSFSSHWLIFFDLNRSTRDSCSPTSPDALRKSSKDNLILGHSTTSRIHTKLM